MGYDPKDWTLIDLLLVARLICKEYPVKARKKHFIKIARRLNPSLGRVIQYIIHAKRHESIIDKYAEALEELYYAITDPAVLENPKVVCIASVTNEWFNVEVDFDPEEIDYFKEHESKLVARIALGLQQKFNFSVITIVTLADRGWSGKEYNIPMEVVVNG